MLVEFLKLTGTAFLNCLCFLIFLLLCAIAVPSIGLFGAILAYSVVNASIWKLSERFAK